MFILPGYEFKNEDGTIDYRINGYRGGKYVVKGKSKLNIGDTNVNGDKVLFDSPLTVESLMSKTYSQKAEY